MQRDLLAELHIPKLEFKNLRSIVTKKSTAPCFLLQGNKEYVKNCSLKPHYYKAETPSMVSELTEPNNALPASIKNLDIINKPFILTNPIIIVDKSFKIGSKVVNLNSGIYPLPKKSPELTGSLVGHSLSPGNSNGAKNAPKIISTSPAIKQNDSFERKLSYSAVATESEGKSEFQTKLGKDFSNCSGYDLLPLYSNGKPNKFPPKNCTKLSVEKSENVPSDGAFSSQNEPVCVISKVIGNANAAFSGVIESHKNFAKLHGSKITALKNTSDKKNKRTDSSASDVSDRQGTSGEINEERNNSAFSGLNSDQQNGAQALKTVAVCSKKIKESTAVNNFRKSNAEISETKAVVSEDDVTEKCSAAAFSDSNDVQKIASESLGTLEKTQQGISKENDFSVAFESSKALNQSEVQLITPKKTDDITKIKGWRRKQFLVEKPTTVEFYRITEVPKPKKIKIKRDNEYLTQKVEETDNPENAFVCDSLDEFLNRDVELKVCYEIPHLYAEIGIKLTSEEIASKPNLSDQDLKEVESRYCVPVQVLNDIINLDLIDEESYKSVKRPIDDDTKPLKFLKLEENKRQSVLNKRTEKLKFEAKRNLMFEGTQERLRGNETVLKLTRRSVNINNVKLESKLFGLVVYPGPFKALHPIVQYHVEKLRSYSTRIDKNWANFAASAVFANDRHYKRRILPVRCCVKIENCAKQTCRSNFVLDEKLSAETVSPKSTKYSKEKIKLKQCSVVIDKINLEEPFSPWCMEHHTYDCKPCGLSEAKFPNMKSLIPPIQTIFTDNSTKDKDEEQTVTSQASFNGKIANLLARKLRILKYRGDTLTSIDCLKKLVPDSVEFIKLNFVKESFLNAYISIWFLKQQTPRTRSRAFLTFSKTPPVPNAISLKSNDFSVKNLPKVITEIVSSDNVFSPNEYAILHCNGQIWEIHGSLNIAFGKPDKNVEQIFASLNLPELKELQKIAKKILKVKAVKWWVVDLSQKFKQIEIKFGNVISVVSRNKFLESARYDSHGFIPIKRNSKGRILGVYIIKPLLPFVLMGPYYLLETHNMTLKGERSTLPFMYFVKENVPKDSPLKYFVNSVIRDVEENDKVLDGLWLYDKMRLDNTSYIEVVTRNLGSSGPSKFASIDIEHGYSLSSLTNCLPPGVTAGVVKRKDGQEEAKKVTVYLYFDVFELGYVEGDLQRDNSVIICHPLDRSTKVKSNKIGDWFVRTIKRRIEFIPKDMQVKWFITKHKEDLRERRPFNKFLLGGAHVLTKNGVFYLLEMSESKIAKLGLEKNEVVKAITESQVINVVIEMKNLANLLSHNPDHCSSMAKVLTKAITEIDRLRSFGEYLKIEKERVEEKKLNLVSGFLRSLSSCPVNDQFKLKMIQSIEHLFVKENGDLSEGIASKFRKYRIGRKYFRLNRKFSRLIEKVQVTYDTYSKTPKKTRKEKCNNDQYLLNSIKRLGFSRVEALIENPTAPEGKSPMASNKVHAKEDLAENSSSLEKTLDLAAAVQVAPVLSKKKGSVQDSKQKDAGYREAQQNKSVTQDFETNILGKGDGFLKLTSSGLPENIKFCWKNCTS